MLAATLYLLSFCVSNLYLAGLVDAGEGCMLMLLAWSLLTGRRWLPLLSAVLGPLSKETFVPLSGAFILAWTYRERRLTGRWQPGLYWAMGAIVTSFVTLMLTRRVVLGYFVWPHQILGQVEAPISPLLGLERIVTDHELWYPFLWLAPLGVWRLGALPRSWVDPCFASAAMAIALGSYADMRGSVNRQLFSALGPMMCLSVAHLLAARRRLESAAGG